MLDRRSTLLDLSTSQSPRFPFDAAAAAAVDNDYPETPEYFRQQRNKRIPTVPRVSPLHAKAMPSSSSSAPSPLFKAADQQSFLQSRVHSLTQALIKSNQHHKRTQEHLTWALEEHAMVQLEKQQLQAQLSRVMALQHGKELDRAPPPMPSFDENDDSDVDMMQDIQGDDRATEQSVGMIQSTAALAQHLRQDNDALKAAFSSHVMEMQRAMTQMTISLHQAQARNTLLAHSDADVAALRATCASLHADRKRLHNTIQELRGNIRVYCRVRPVLKLQHGACAAIRVESDTRVVVTQHSPNGSTVSQDTVFDVDKVFDQHHSQHDVFTEVQPLITSALDGYNVCVLAYGQTGSGKTHTMLGSLESDVDRGLSPRVFGQVFAQCHDNQSDIEMHLSVLEVYNEKVMDLVHPSPVPLDVRVDKKLGVTVPHRTWEGDRRSEAQHINKSLLALRHVLLQLKNKQEYVSYRDSKLTLLLQDAIGGHAKTLLVVCVNPSGACAHESKCSLAFGERANAVELGRAKQHITSSTSLVRGNNRKP
ncbi:hypothetical protein B5M09_006267 [Aphanomyces astaci]|uniref:Kinesin motor domain-containing protein n=1 Tax=Aphanomyces astaci TaxID=112090 RepID=A0A3R7Y6N0_APHAT|nr:hypothetical protein B5M09_006267 [Aphanomyces astaci]